MLQLHVWFSFFTFPLSHSFVYALIRFRHKKQLGLENDMVWFKMPVLVATNIAWKCPEVSFKIPGCDTTNPAGDGLTYLKTY